MIVDSCVIIISPELSIFWSVEIISSMMSLRRKQVLCVDCESIIKIKSHLFFLAESVVFNMKESQCRSSIHLQSICGLVECRKQGVLSGRMVTYLQSI